MYRLFFVSGIFAFFVLLGCKEETDMPEVMDEEEVICSSQDSFYFTGLLNGEVWRSKTHSFFYRFQDGKYVVSLGGNDGDSGEQFMDGGTLNLVTESDVHPNMMPISAFFVFLYGDTTGEFYEIPPKRLLS